MAEIATKPAAGHEASRIVFLGLPDSGKSALLGALAQAVHNQDKVLGSHLDAHTLEPLQKYIYDKGPEPEQPDIAEFTATLEPVDEKPGPDGDTVFLDCDGEITADFLKQPQPLTAKQGLGKEVSIADTVVLVVDCRDRQLKQSFDLFNQFLGQLEERRTQGVEVTGLPVYLVLTKCDLMAKETDANMDWVTRIDGAKRQLEKFFKDYLARALPENNNAFGKIDLHLWATATGRPKFTDRPANPQEPYGVAELFRQCLQSAGGFRQRRRKAGHKLQASVAGSTGLVAFLLLLAVVFFATRADPEHAGLESKIQSLVPGKKDKPSVRFKEPLDDKILKLKDLLQAQGFVHLPDDRQEEVTDYLEEVTAYRDFDRSILTKISEPRFANSDQDLSLIKESLVSVRRLVPTKYLELKKVDAALGMIQVFLPFFDADLRESEPPHKLNLDKIMHVVQQILAANNYHSDWLETKAVQRYCLYRFDATAFDRNVKEAIAGIQMQKEEGENLHVEATELILQMEKLKVKTAPAIKPLTGKVNDWLDRYGKFRTRPNKYKKSEKGMDITHERLPNSLLLTNSVIPSFESVHAAQLELEQVKSGLETRNKELRKKYSELNKK